MNPHRKYKNHEPGGFVLIFVMLSLFFVPIVLNPIHKKSVQKPLSQQYTLNQFDPIWFYKPDEIGWTRGQVVYLWNYYPVIHSQDFNKTFEFKEVEWVIGND